ncbi:response regulator [Pseudomonas chlororaphis]|uniref:response regulator n=1 Tax=Pseudomonas chlororaphis TaxID=587753 RepID=UPI00352B9896
MKNLRIAIADDHPIALLGVRKRIELNQQFCLVGEAVCALSLIELLEQQSADVVITDYNMPTHSPF